MALTPEQEAVALAAQTAAIEDQVKLRKELNELTKQQIDYLLNNLPQAEKLSAAQGEALVSLQIQRQKNLALLQKEVEYYNDLVTQAKTEEERSKNQLKALQARIDKQKELVKEGKAERSSIKEMEEDYEKLDKTIKDAKETTNELVGAFGDLLKGNLTGGLKKLGGSLVKNLKNKLMDKFTDSIFSLVRAGPKGIAALGGLAASFALIGVAVSIASKVIKLAIAVVDASNAFQKATGTSNEFASSLITVGNDVRAFGGTIEEVSASFQSLFTNVSDFTMMSKASREELIKTNTVLSKLGVSNDDLARSQQILIKSMGQTATQAAKTSRELAALAMDIGVAPSKMASDFAAAGPQLAKFGRDGVKAFKDLAQTSKITGIEVNRLLAITEKFDTFEGAAEQAGKLNAALGGNFVNAMELLTETDPTKRFEQMTDAIKDAGKSFDDMTYFEAKFFAQAMGLQDVNELALALSGNMDMVGKFTKKSSAEYEALAERAAKVQSFQEKMNTLMAQLIPIVEPLVNGLLALSDWMMENLEVVKIGFSVMIGLTAGLAVAMTILAVSTLAAASPFFAVAAAIGAVTAVLAGLASLLFVQSFASSFLEGIGKVGNAFGLMGENAQVASGDIKDLTGEASKLAKNGLFGSQGLKVASETTTKSIGEMNVAMRGASVGAASATTEANTYAMSQVGDTITTNTQNYMGSREPMNVNLNVDGKKLAMATVGPMIRSTAMG
jgi:hypothetical protein